MYRPRLMDFTDEGMMEVYGFDATSARPKNILDNRYLIKTKNPDAFPNKWFDAGYTNLVLLFRLVNFYSSLYDPDDEKDPFWLFVAQDLGCERLNDKKTGYMVSFWTRARQHFLSSAHTPRIQSPLSSSSTNTAAEQAAALAPALVDAWSGRDLSKSGSYEGGWARRRAQWRELKHKHLEKLLSPETPASAPLVDLLRWEENNAHGERKEVKNPMIPATSIPRQIFIKGSYERLVAAAAGQGASDEPPLPQIIGKPGSDLAGRTSVVSVAGNRDRTDGTHPPEISPGTPRTPASANGNNNNTSAGQASRKRSPDIHTSDSTSKRPRLGVEVTSRNCQIVIPRDFGDALRAPQKQHGRMEEEMAQRAEKTTVPVPAAPRERPADEDEQSRLSKLETCVAFIRSQLMKFAAATEELKKNEARAGAERTAGLERRIEALEALSKAGAERTAGLERRIEAPEALSKAGAERTAGLERRIEALEALPKMPESSAVTEAATATGGDHEREILVSETALSGMQEMLGETQAQLRQLKKAGATIHNRVNGHDAQVSKIDRTLRLAGSNLPRLQEMDGWMARIRGLEAQRARISALESRPVDPPVDMQDVKRRIDEHDAKLMQAADLAADRLGQIAELTVALQQARDVADHADEAALEHTKNFQDFSRRMIDRDDQLSASLQQTRDIAKNFDASVKEIEQSLQQLDDRTAGQFTQLMRSLQQLEDRADGRIAELSDSLARIRDRVKATCETDLGSLPQHLKRHDGRYAELSASLQQLRESTRTTDGTVKELAQRQLQRDAASNGEFMESRLVKLEESIQLKADKCDDAGQSLAKIDCLSQDIKDFKTDLREQRTLLDRFRNAHPGAAAPFWPLPVVTVARLNQLEDQVTALMQVLSDWTPPATSADGSTAVAHNLLPAAGQTDIAIHGNTAAGGVGTGNGHGNASNAVTSSSPQNVVTVSRETRGEQSAASLIRPRGLPGSWQAD